MAKKSCKKGYYYCYASKKCKRIPMGYYVGGGGWLRKEEEKSEDTEGKKKNGNGANGNGNGNGESSGGSDGGGVSEGWSAKYKRSIDCNNPKGFSQRAHCQGRKKVNEATMSPAQKRKDTMLKKKYDKSDMKQNMIDQYGKEEGTKIYFATIRKQAMKTEAKEHEDHEVSMAQSQLKKSERNIKKLRKALGTKEKNIPAWVQAKITDTEHNTDAAAGYMEEGKRDGKSAKSKGYSLRDWFKGGGWVQTGGKYDGKPCAKQPGQKTKPYCRDADDRASMSKEERNKRARKKRKEDPNPNRKGKARNVKQESYSSWRTELDEGILDFLNPKNQENVRQGSYHKDPKVKKGTIFSNVSKRNEMLKRLQNQSFEPEGELVDEGKKDACYHKVKSRYSVWPSAYASGALVKCRKVGAANWGNKTKKEGYELGEMASEKEVNKKLQKKVKSKDLNPAEYIKNANMMPGSGIPKKLAEDILSEGLEEKLSKMSPEQIENLIKANRGAEDKIRATLRKMKSATPKPQGKGAQLPNVPKQPASTSSYTSRETYQRGGSDRVSYQRKPRPNVKPKPVAKVGLGKKVLRTLSKVKNPRVAAALGLGALSAGMITTAVRGIRKKTQQNEGYEFSNWRDDFQATEYETVDIIKPEPLQPSQSIIDEGGKKCWKGYKKVGTQKLFGKTYNRCVKAHFSDWRADMDLQEKKAKKDYDGDGKIESGKDEYMGSRDKAIKKAIAMKEDWQKSNRKDGVDGMSQKSVDAYKRENPGSKLQTAVTGKNPKGKDKKRRKSFCARSKGQKDMHNIDCSKTPDKKICKARKRWRC